MFMVCMVFGEKCNWKCEYCDRPKILEPRNADFDLIKEYYPRIVKWVKDVPLHISGGETALVDREILDYVFSFNKKLVVETNGLWFEKGYHSIYNEGIERIIYHCVPELDHDIKHKISYAYNLIVVHHLNIHLLKDFIERNEPREWILQYYYPKYLGDHQKFNLTTDDYFYLIKNFPNLISKKDIAKRILKSNDMDGMRRECFKKLNFPGFDFVNARIKFCKQSHSFTDYVELNEVNFDLLINDKLKSNKAMDDICRTCIEVVNYTS